MKRCLVFTTLVTISTGIITFLLSDLLLVAVFISMLMFLVSIICYLGIYNVYQKKILIKLLSEDFKEFGINRLMGYKIKEIEVFDETNISNSSLGKIRTHDFGYERNPLIINRKIIGYLIRIRTVNGIIYQYEYKLLNRYFDFDKLKKNAIKLGFISEDLDFNYVLFENSKINYGIYISNENNFIIVTNNKVLKERNREDDNIKELIY